MNEEREYAPDPGKELASTKPRQEALVPITHERVLDLVEQALQARRAEHEEMVVLPKDLQIAVLEIRDALKMQARSTAELAAAIQQMASRGGSGVGGY